MRILSKVMIVMACLCAFGMAEIANAGPKVKLQTNYGDIVLELNREKAPKTVKNFLNYVNSGFYDGTIFHRVIGNFMIQGGGFTEDMKQKETKAPVKSEASNGLSNKKYTVAMARTNHPDSATAQFYINVVDNKGLDYNKSNPGYTVFGKVIRGQNVVDKIKAVSTGRKGRYSDVPSNTVIINKASITE